MDSTTLAAVIALGIAGLTQVIKDRLKLDPAKLRYGIPILAGGLALVVSVIDGDTDMVKTLINMVVGAFIPAGAHGVFLQGDKPTGQVLKAIGKAILPGPDNPPILPEQPRTQTADVVQTIMGLRAAHPDWTASQVRAELTRLGIES